MSSIKDKMKEIGFYPKKSLSQNFLINPFIIQKIVTTVEGLKPSLIMEVGPGLGALTNHLISLPPPLYVIEKDTLLCQYWRKKGINIWEGDVLKPKGFIYQNRKLSSSSNIEEVSWSSLLLPGSVLIGNLPYHIASRLMVQCCPGPDKIKSLVFMFQKEVAQRILASPGSKNYGLLSVLSQCFWKGHFLIEASISDFYPRPKVAGQVLVFHKKNQIIPHSKDFLAFVKLCFSHRRKFLLNQLKTIKEKSHIIDIFDKMNLPSSTRAEELFPNQFISLFNKIITGTAIEKKRGLEKHSPGGHKKPS